MRPDVQAQADPERTGNTGRPAQPIQSNNACSRSVKQHLSPRRGFSMIEIIVVLLILSIMAAFMVPGLLQKTDDAKFSRAKVQLAQDMPVAIGAYLKAYLSVRGNDEQSITRDLAEFGAPIETPFSTSIAYTVEFQARNPRNGYKTERQIEAAFPLPERVMGTNELAELVNFVNNSSRVPMAAQVDVFDDASFRGLVVYYNTQ